MDHEIVEMNMQLLNNTKTAITKNAASDIPVIDLDTSDDDEHNQPHNNNNNKRKKLSEGMIPDGFLDPLPPKDVAALPRVASCKQFWKSGDFEGRSVGDWTAASASGGIDHLRVHPRFLHSNATSHKWVLGAFAELLDNSLDESCSGATYVKIDMLTNKKDNERMLLIEDDGGGMSPEKMRYCMSLGYSLKSKVKDTIGQYGNGFKTSTMRLGADVIVFTRCSGKYGKTPTQSIGLLSYTFLTRTGKDDIIVPMLDYAKSGQKWRMIKRSSAGDWNTNVETMLQWSPFSSEADLLKQFDHMKDQGTRIIIYNLWEDDQGKLELDFDADDDDIQIRGVNRDEKKIEMAQQYPNSRHYLTYRHSLRSYASILYLRVPHNFRMILRGRDVEYHSIINDMMMTNVVTYRPHSGLEGIPKDSNIVVFATVGFVKDAKAHIDVQGFNVYHKNRLIKPFWRLWHVAGSRGRGIIGVLEADFVEPAHDKQGFEQTTALQRLEGRLLQMQKTYWYANCHKVGYTDGKSEDTEPSPDQTAEATIRRSSRTRHAPKLDNIYSQPHKKSVITKPNRRPTAVTNGNNNNSIINIGEKRGKSNGDSGVTASSSKSTSVPLTENNRTTLNKRHANGRRGRLLSDLESLDVDGNGTDRSNSSNPSLELVMEQNHDLKERLKRREEEVLGDLMQNLKYEKNRRNELEAQLEKAKQKYEVLKKEHDSLIAIQERKEAEEQTLRKKLKEAETTTKDLMEKVTQLQLEKMKRMGSLGAI